MPIDRIPEGSSFDEILILEYGLEVDDLATREGWEKSSAYKEAYKALVIKYHPDKNLNNTIVATQNFNVISAAYKKLKQQIPKEQKQQERNPRPDLAEYTTMYNQDANIQDANISDIIHKIRYQEEYSGDIVEAFLKTVKFNPDNIKSLLKVDNISINLADSRGRTLFMAAIEEFKGEEEVGKLEGQIQIDLDLKCNKGKTALHYAAENGCNKIAKDILNIVSPVIDPKKKEKTNFHSHIGSYIPRYRIDKETNMINAQDKDGKTALHYAVENNHPELVKELLSRNPNLELKDKTGETAEGYIGRGKGVSRVREIFKQHHNHKGADKGCEIM
jgi:hypothetical protein